MRRISPDTDAGKGVLREADLLPLLEGARPEQQRAICSAKPLVVVSAGAGTGKTYTLAARYAWLIASDPTCSVDRILTLTFTQLAAEEMRERIAHTLRSWYDRLIRTNAPSALAHISRAIERLDESYVSTIHAFSLRVIRESGLALDLDPTSSLVGEPLEREFWEEWDWSLRTLSVQRIPALLPGDAGGAVRGLLHDAAFVSVLNFFGSDRLTELARAAGEAFGSRNLTPEDFRSFDDAGMDGVRLRLRAALERDCREVWELWQVRVLPDLAAELLRTPGGGKFAETLRAFVTDWNAPEPGEDAPLRFFADLVTRALSALPGTSRLKNRLEESLGEGLRSWRDRYAEKGRVAASLLSGARGYDENEARVRRLLLTCGALGWSAWDAARRNAGVLSFADLIRFAARVLRENPVYAARFRHVMVDEFQDTDGLQDEMLRSVVDAWAAERDGEERRTLFLVGDVKQSIYRFRHADPALFASYIAEASRAGERAEHIPLACSYRMNERLMRSVNRVFERLWADGVIRSEGGDWIPYHPLLPPADVSGWDARNARVPEMPLEAIVYRSGDVGEEETEDAASMRAALATALVARLRALVAEGAEIWDKALSAFRPLRWGDVVVLTPTRTPYPILEEAFANAGIPAAFSRSKVFFDRGEVLDIVNYLRLLDRPDDAFALAGWLESPFSGLAPGAVATLHAQARDSGKSLRDVFGAAHPDADRRLRLARCAARLSGPSEILLRLLEDAGWLAAYPAEVGERMLANVRHAVGLVREYEATFGRSLSACADYLGREMRARRGVEEPDLPYRDLDVVRVMTVHAAKGLEFPVVALMGVEYTPGRGARTSRLAVSRNLGVVASKLPCAHGGTGRSAGVESLTALWHRLLEEDEVCAEHERLFYVAATRARDLLICCGIDKRRAAGATSSGRGESWLDWLLPADAGDADGLCRLTEISGRTAAKQAAERSGKTVESCFPFPPSPRQANIACDVLRERPCLARFSATAYALFSWCPVAYRLRYRQGRALKWELPDGDGYGGADLGSLAHWVMARWDLLADSLAHYLPDTPAEADTLRVPPFLRPIYAQHRERRALAFWLSAFAATKVGGALRERRAGGGLRRELPFSVLLEGMRLVGSIDVYWEDAEGCHVRDWKITQAWNASDLFYARQLDFYALAVHLMRPEMPVDVGLVHLRPEEAAMDKRKPHAVLPEDWLSIEADVRSAAERAATGPFTPRGDRCADCPFRGRCADSDLFPDAGGYTERIDIC